MLAPLAINISLFFFLTIFILRGGAIFNRPALLFCLIVAPFVRRHHCHFDCSRLFFYCHFDQARQRRARGEICVNLVRLRLGDFSAALAAARFGRNDRVGGGVARYGRKERSDGIAIVRRRRNRVTLFRQCGQ